jgi:hypothetical protein
MFRKLTTALALTLLAGCALFQGAQDAGQFIAQEGTAIYIQSGCSGQVACYDKNAARVLIFAQQLETATTGTLLSVVQTAVNSEIAKLNLSPAEAAPLLSLETQLFTYLQSKISSTSVLTASSLAILQQVAGWVVQEASIYSPSAVVTYRAKFPAPPKK